jgi:hypothetical protein
MPRKVVSGPQTTASDEIDFPPLVRFEFSQGRSLLNLGGGGPGAAEARQACVAALSCSGSGGGSGGGSGAPTEVAAHHTLLPPLIVPSMPHSFCIQMTRGSFVDYTRSCLLHCGIADSTGCVWNFDEVSSMHTAPATTPSITVPVWLPRCDFDCPASAHVPPAPPPPPPPLPPSLLSWRLVQHGHHRHASWRECICVPLPGHTRASKVVSTDGARVSDEAGPDTTAVHGSVAPVGRRCSFDSELKLFDDWHQQQGGAFHGTANNCYHYAVGFLNHVHFQGRADHTVHTIERELLSKPCLAALNYLRCYMLLASGGGMTGAPPSTWHPSTVICLLEQQDGKSVHGLTSAQLDALVREGQGQGQQQLHSSAAGTITGTMRSVLTRLSERKSEHKAQQESTEGTSASTAVPPCRRMTVQPLSEEPLPEGVPARPTC